MEHNILPDDNFLQTVRPIIRNALVECEKVLPSQRQMSVIVNYTDDDFIKEKMSGTTGVTGDETGFKVSVNTTVEGWQKALFGSVAHEYNHAIWFYEHSKTWEDVVVKDNIAIEGLAVCFEEMLSGVTPPYAKATSRDEAKNTWEKLQPHFTEPAGEWTARAWLADNDEFPLWAGYTLSYLVIKEQTKKLNLSWPELMMMETDELVGAGLS